MHKAPLNSSERARLLVTTHVAVLKRPYADLIVRGVKRIESRLTLTRREPFGVVSVGDIVLFKDSGGPYRARARAARVESFDDLTPARVRELRGEYNEQIKGSSAYWLSKRLARYATLVWLEDVLEIDRGPRLPHLQGRAWVTLPTGPRSDAPARTPTRSRALTASCS